MARGIGRILHLIKEEEKGDARTSIVKQLDEACANGVVYMGRFSLRKIKGQLHRLFSFFGPDKTFNRDKFFVEFFKFYSCVMAPDAKAKGVFHPSQLLKGCSRQMTYDLMGTEPTDKIKRKVSGGLQRTFDVGTWYHVYFQTLLFNMGYLEASEVPVVNKERFLNGKADGVFKPHVFGERVVLEIKSMNNWTFQKAIFKPFKHHEFQASLYARELGVKKILYLYINKDTSEIRDFLMPINEEQLEIADKKMEIVINSIKEGTLPARPKSCTDKFCDSAIECPFATLCFS